MLELRKARKLPWHSPPHLDFKIAKQYLISSSCYEHFPERMTECEAEVLKICENFLRESMHGAYFPTIIICCLEPNGLVNSATRLESSMDALLSNGIKVMGNRVAKSGTTALKGQ